jgi:VanZ family protein
MGRVRQASALRVWFAGVALALYVAFILVVTLSPSPVDLSFRHDLESLLEKLHDRGVPEFVGYGFVEFASNVVLFIPLGFIASLVLPRRGWWLVLLLGPLFSGAIELAQRLFLPERFATVSDILANSIGAIVGAIAAVLLKLLIAWRDRLVLDDASASRARASAGQEPAP